MRSRVDRLAVGGATSGREEEVAVTAVPGRRSSIGARLLTIGCVGLFIAMVLTSYVYVEGTIWDRYPFHTLPGLFFPLSIAMAMLPSLWLRVRDPRPYDVALWILYVTSVIPVNLFIYHVVPKPPEEAAVFASSITGAFALLSLMGRFRPREMRGGARTTGSFVTIWATVTVVTMIALYYGLSREQTALSLSLENMYERRGSAMRVFASLRGLSYAAAALGKSLAPLLLVIALATRRFSLLVPGLIGLGLAFSISGEKTVALIPVFVLAVMLLLRWARSRFAPVLLLLTSLGIGVSMYSYLEYDAMRPSLLFTHRLFILKGVLTSYYWDFFTDNPFVWFSDTSLMRMFADPVYQLPYPNLIGEAYMGDDGLIANASMWAAGYAHLGYFGVFLVTAVTGGVLWIIECLSLNRNTYVCEVVAALFALLLSDAALHTSLLTNGMLLTLLIVYSMPVTSGAAQARLVGAPAQ